MRITQTILAVGIFFLIFTSCKSEAGIDADNGNEIRFEIESAELTSGEKEEERDKIILNEVNKFIATTKSDAVLNYIFLCDSLMISANRAYEVDHKTSNISIGIGKENVRLTPIPSSYKINEGPIASYKINDDSLGEFASYFLDLQLDENYKITSFKGTLRFMKEKDGTKRLSFMKEINAEDKYLLAEKLKSKNW